MPVSKPIRVVTGCNNSTPVRVVTSGGDPVRIVTEGVSDPVRIVTGGASTPVIVIGGGLAPDAPTFVSGEVGTVDASTVVVTFSTDITAPCGDCSLGFTVLVNGVPDAITACVIVGGNTVQLTLTTAVAFGDTVTVSYDSTVGCIMESTAVTDLATFGAQAATNNVAFVPTDIVGLEFWVAGNQIVGLSDGDPIGTWVDFSGNTYDATAAGAARPTYKTGILNGLPVARFNGGSNVMLTANATSPALNQPTTIFVVGKSTAVNGNFIDSRAGNFTHLMDHQVNGTYPVIRMYAGGALSPLMPTIDSGYHLYTAQFNGASSISRTDGHITVTGNAGATALAGISLGTWSGGWLNGDIAEIIVYSGALTPTQQWQVNHYLGVKYGLDVRRWETLVFDGDSLTNGSYATAGNSYPEQCQRIMSPFKEYRCGLGAAGKRIDERDTNAPVEIDPYVPVTTDHNCLVFWCGINDVFNGDSAATIEGRLQTYIANRRTAGWTKIITCTLTNQLFDVTYDANRLLFNTWLRSNWASFSDGLADIQAAALLQDPNDGTYFYSDKCHFVDAGYAVVAGIVRTAINSVLAVG